MSTITLLKGFNNYYNRIRKDRATLAAYRSAASSYATFTDINFYPADGVNTTQTLNTSVVDADYLIVSNGSTIKSRWFVIEQNRNRQGQTIYKLRRDVIIDMQAAISEATVYCYKGAVPFTYTDYEHDPAMYNEEEFRANERISEQIYITQPDVANPWIVIYIAKDGNKYTIQEHDWNDPTNTQMLDVGVLAADPLAKVNAPYSIVTFDAGAAGTTTRRNALYLAGLITTQLSGAGACYDAQMSPYKPSVTNTTQTMSIYNGTQSVTIHYASSADLTFTKSVDIDQITPATRAKAKASNQLCKCVMYSPGLASAYEFNPFKLGCRELSAINVKVNVTFRPHNLYIHIKPENYRGLYGVIGTGASLNTDKDARGLYVMTDYSLPITSQAWATYELNNKNYAAAFNRETQTLELQRDIADINSLVGAMSGALGAAESGSIIGGGAGAIAGAIGGTITGGVDMVTGMILRNDALNNRIAQHNYYLRNIKSQPAQLQRAPALVIDSQIYPYIISYNCSSTEENAFYDYIKYNGMTINRYGKFKDFFDELGSDVQFMSCELKRISIQEDAHVVDVINQELKAGIYKEV